MSGKKRPRPPPSSSSSSSPPAPDRVLHGLVFGVTGVESGCGKARNSQFLRAGQGQAGVEAMALVGEDKRALLFDRIQGGGGTVCGILHKNIFALVCGDRAAAEAATGEPTQRLRKALKFGVPIVAPAFVERCLAEKRALNPRDHIIDAVRDRYPADKKKTKKKKKKKLKKKAGDGEGDGDGDGEGADVGERGSGGEGAGGGGTGSSGGGAGGGGENAEGTGESSEEGDDATAAAIQKKQKKEKKKKTHKKKTKKRLPKDTDPTAGVKVTEEEMAVSIGAVVSRFHIECCCICHDTDDTCPWDPKCCDKSTAKVE